METERLILVGGGVEQSPPKDQRKREAFTSTSGEGRTSCGNKAEKAMKSKGERPRIA